MLQVKDSHGRRRYHEELRLWDAGLCIEGQQLTVLAQMEVTKEELDVDEGVRAALGSRGRLQLLWGNTLYHKDDLPFRSDMSELPDVFTPFKQKVTAHCNPRKLTAL